MPICKSSALQDVVLSPFLFITYINELSDIMEPTCLSILLSLSLSFEHSNQLKVTSWNDSLCDVVM